MKAASALVIALILVSSAHGSSSFTAGELAKDCKRDISLTSTLDDDYSQGLCTGYVLGWMDTTTDSDIVTEGGPARVVFEDGVNVGQLKRVFIKYMDQHPEFENQPASVALTKSAQDAHLAHAAPVKRPLLKEQ